ncbi:MAG: POT family proton-dependent oligopeptide transporter [Paraglaciecola sp.]|jgi:POT family proton-dependent oligopeptide transporter
MGITEMILLFGWVFVLAWIPFVIYTNKNTHPKALFICFGAEMWERFSYYGMRALLTLYMAKVLFVELGAGADARALGIYGSYTSMVYLSPVIGGLIADKIFGFRKAVMWGGILMMIGHFALGIAGMAFEESLPLFFISLAFIIIGNGFFKPNISSFLGTFYGDNDPRKDGAFTIFYMGVNIGAFLSTLTCGYLGEQVGWHWGFGVAGIGMGIGVLVFHFLGKDAFGDKGLPPDPVKAAQPVVAGLSQNALVGIGTLIAIPVVAFLLDMDKTMATVLLVIATGVILYLIADAVKRINNGQKEEGQRLLVIIVLFFFHAVFWALFEQAGGSLTLFTDTNVDRSAFGGEIPASIFQSLNPFYIMILAPVFSWIWVNLSKRKMEPSTPMKFVLGLAQLALGFLVIVIAARGFVDQDGKIPVIFLFLMYLLHTTGELSLSPVGLSMISKLSPKRIVGFVMGAWFLSIALANKMAGAIGQMTSGSAHGASPDGLTAMETLAQYSDTYMTWGVYVVGGAALLLLLMVPVLKKWTNGIH